MKKILAILISAIVLCVPVMAHVDGGYLGDIPTTTEDITVDAVMDEIYNYGLKVDITSALDTNPVNSSAVAYLLYKDGNLYVYAEVTDDDVVIPNADDQANQPWVCDSLEVFINANNSAESTDIVQYRIDNEGWPCAYDQNGLAAYGADAAAEYFTFAEVDTDAGYNVEYCIPVAVTTFGISFQINNVYSDGTAQDWAQVYSAATGAGPGSWNAENYPYVSINGTASLPAAETEAPATETAAAEDTAAEDTTTTAPQTADIVAVAALVSVIALAGVIVSKKH